MTSNRTFRNTLLMSGEPRHFNAWEFPSVPRLQPLEEPARRRSPYARPASMTRGLERLLHAIRAR